MLRINPHNKTYISGKKKRELTKNSKTLSDYGLIYCHKVHITSVFDLNWRETLINLSKMPFRRKKKKSKERIDRAAMVNRCKVSRGYTPRTIPGGSRMISLIRPQPLQSTPESQAPWERRLPHLERSFCKNRISMNAINENDIEPSSLNCVLLVRLFLSGVYFT